MNTSTAKDLEAAVTACTDFVKNNSVTLCTAAIAKALTPRALDAPALSAADFDFAHAAFLLLNGSAPAAVHETASYQEMLTLGAQLVSGSAKKTLQADLRKQLIASVVSGPESLQLIATYRPVLRFPVLRQTVAVRWANFIGFVEAADKCHALPWLLLGADELIICPAPTKVSLDNKNVFAAVW
jgi:hypothetical protein